MKILEYENKIKETIAKYIDAKSDCLEAIEKLDSDIKKLILRLKYINGKTHQQVADTIGYSLEQEKRYHERALKNFEIPKS